MNLQPYLDFTRQLAHQAGKLTLEYFNKGIQHDMKADETPVTAADRAAEEFIRREIEKEYPSHAIVGEEFGESPSPNGRGDRGEGDFRWIIDPIDGTKSFIKSVPFYSVLIGLEIEGISRVGAACFPALDEVLYAADGLGAWCNGKRVHVSDVSEMKKAVFTFTSWSGFRTRKRLDVFENLHRDCFIGRGWGDAYGVYLVATGRTEIHVEPSVALWDVAPFPPIFREAGGYFGSWNGEEGHTHSEALAVNAALKPKVMDLMRSGFHP